MEIEVKVEESTFLDFDDEDNEELAKAEGTHLAIPEDFGPPVKSKHLTEAQVREMEDTLYNRSLELCEGLTAMQEIDPEDKEPPPDWVTKYGRKRAEERFRIAKYGLLNQQEAPNGLRLVSHTLGQMLKARSLEKNNGMERNINVQFIQMTAPMPDFRRKKIDHE